MHEEFNANKRLTKDGRTYFYVKDGKVYLQKVNMSKLGLKIPKELDNYKDFILIELGPDGKSIIFNNLNIKE